MVPRDLVQILATTATAICGLAGGCGIAQESPFSARSSDGRITFHLSEGAARSAFSSFCESHPGEPCDDFERYKIEIVFDDDLSSLTFVHEDPQSLPSNAALSIVCAYSSRGRECASGRHRY